MNMHLDKGKMTGNISDSTPDDDEIIKKIYQCCKLYDFKTEQIDNYAVKHKRKTLQQLVIHLVTKREISEEVTFGILKMISINIFRASPSEGQILDPENDLNGKEPSWEHLKWVYELLQILLNSQCFYESVEKKSIDRNFIIQLLNLLDSKDLRERRCLLRTLYQIYKNFVHLRAVIRTETVYILLRFIYEDGVCNGIDELVQLLGIIIHGLDVPLKDKHKVLYRILGPLHRIECLSLYHRHLTYCVLEMARKNPDLTCYFIEGLLFSWPRTHTANQVLFLTEIKEILTLTTLEQFEKIREPLIKQIAKSSCDLHLNVAECALRLWHDESWLRLMDKNIRVVMPVMFPALCTIVEEHWSQQIMRLALIVLKKFKNMDAQLLHDLITTTNFDNDRVKLQTKVGEDMIARFENLENIFVNLRGDNPL